MKKTFLVMVHGYWGGSDKSLKEAAERCERAGGGRMDLSSAKVVVGDDKARLTASHIEYNQGSEVIELGHGYRLGHFLNLKA